MSAIGVIATLTVAEGKQAEFEQAFAQLTEQVRANEPGVVFYALHKSQADPLVYKVLEQYQNKAALDAHGQTDYFKAAGAELAKWLTSAPDIEVLEAV